MIVNSHLNGHTLILSVPIQCASCNSTPLIPMSKHKTKYQFYVKISQIGQKEKEAQKRLCN